MYESEDIIADYARRNGSTREEARVLYYLDRLVEAFARLPDIKEVEVDQLGALHQSLVNMMAVRVASRDHPEGWRPYEEYPGAGT